MDFNGFPSDIELNEENDDDGETFIDDKWSTWKSLVRYHWRDFRKLDNVPRERLSSGNYVGSASGYTTGGMVEKVFKVIREYLPDCHHFMDAGHGTGVVVMWASLYFPFVYGVEVNPQMELPLYSSLDCLSATLSKDEHLELRHLLPRASFLTTDLTSYSHFEPVEAMFCNLEGISKNVDWPVISAILDRTRTLRLVFMASRYPMSETWMNVRSLTSSFGICKVWFRSEPDAEAASQTDLEGLRLPSTNSMGFHGVKLAIEAKLLDLRTFGTPNQIQLPVQLISGANQQKRKRGRPAQVHYSQSVTRIIAKL